MQTTPNIINHLSLQAIQTNDSGLYHGRMGIILALYCHGVAYGNKDICDYASDVLQLTVDNYYDGDITLENGLSGIGLGFVLLYKAGMFRDNLNELLFDIDKKIMSFDPRRMTNKTFRTGAAGLLYYIKARQSIGQTCESIHDDYIKELEDCTHCVEKAVSQTCFTDDLRQPTWNMEDFLEKEAGIDNGCAYYLIKDSYGKVFSC